MKRIALIIAVVFSVNVYSQTAKNTLQAARTKDNVNRSIGKKITLTEPPSISYPKHATALALVDGIQAGEFDSSQWLGWNGKNMEAIIDLGKIESINHFAINVWKQETNSIFLPASVEVHTSDNGTTWNSLQHIDSSTRIWFKQYIRDGKKLNSEWDSYNPLNYNIISSGPINIRFTTNTIQTRFVKIIVANYGKIPEGKPNAGNNTWMFIDEIEINKFPTQPSDHYYE